MDEGPVSSERGEAATARPRPYLTLTCQNTSTFLDFPPSNRIMQSRFAVLAPSPQIFKPWVVGSIPTALTNFRRAMAV